MKNLKLFAFLAVVSCIGACSSDDDDGSANNGLNGAWYLVKAVAPDSGTTEDFNKGDIKWTINESSSKVITSVNRIHVMTPEPSGMYSYPNGTYNYQINAWGGTCDHSFHINDYNFGCVILDKNSLTLTTEAVDGVRYSFIR